MDNLNNELICYSDHLGNKISLTVLHFQMVDYLSNLTYVMLRKSFGKSIEDDPSIERLVENRTVLEKMRPIEKKLKYQVWNIL